MSMTWALNTSNDLSISGGKLAITTSADEVKQRILVTLQHHWQEYFLNVPGGVPWYDLILGGKDVKLYEAILRNIILSVPGVASIIDFYTTFSNRAFSLYTSVEVTWATGTQVTSLSIASSSSQPIDSWADVDTQISFDIGG